MMTNHLCLFVPNTVRPFTSEMISPFTISIIIIVAQLALLRLLRTRYLYRQQTQAFVRALQSIHIRKYTFLIV